MRLIVPLVSSPFRKDVSNAEYGFVARDSEDSC